MYLANDHPDIDYAVNCLARRASKPTRIDEQRLRRVVRYLRGHQIVVWQYEPVSIEFPSETQTQTGVATFGRGAAPVED